MVRDIVEALDHPLNAIIRTKDNFPKFVLRRFSLVKSHHLYSFILESHDVLPSVYQ